MKKVFTLHGCMVTFKDTTRYICEELLQVFTCLHESSHNSDKHKREVV